MRILALYLACVLMAVGLVPRSWAHADRISVGVRNFTEDSSYEQRAKPLAELNLEGDSFAHEGLAVLVFGCVAAVGSAAASSVLRKRISVWLRAGLVATQVASLIATLVFVHRLLGFGYLALGWSVPACVASAILGAGAMLAWRSKPAR